MRSQVRKVMSDVLGVSEENIADDATSETLGTWTSIAHLNLIMALEDQFSVRFSDRQIPDLVSCEAIAAAIQSARDAGKTTQ